MAVAVKVGLHEHDVQVAELGVALHIHGKVDLVHLGTDEQDARSRILPVYIGYQVEDDGCLAHARVTDDHVVHPLGQSLVTTQQVIQHCPRTEVHEQPRIKPHISHVYYLCHG